VCVFVIGFGLVVPSAFAGFTAAENFNLFGDQQNFTCPGIGGVCGAIAAINSFIFLENMYPGTYRLPNAPGLLTPNYVAANNNDPIDSNNFANTGWQVGTNPPRTGYYNRTGTAGGDYIATLTDWFSDFAPNTSRLSSWFAGSTQNNRLPTINDLGGELAAQEDVQIFVQNANFYHVLTLYSLVCTDNANTMCTARWQDPNDPTNGTYSSAVTINGGQLSIAGVLGAGGAVNITAAFSESPIPEPETLAFVAGGVMLLLVSRFSVR